MIYKTQNWLLKLKFSSYNLDKNVKKIKHIKNNQKKIKITCEKKFIYKM